MHWRAIAVLLEIYANIKNKGFYCKALKGDSSNNICINSDLTVSCTCNDNYGLGKIGDLKKESLKEIFSGERASNFRKMFSNGKLPIPNCARCRELCWTDKKKAGAYVSNYNLPKKGIRIENTVNCNLNCLSCNREGIYSYRSEKTMALKDIKRVSSFIREYEIRKVRFTNLGEPFFQTISKKSSK